MTNEIVCKYGRYENNVFYDSDGSEYFTISYRSVNKIIDGKTGFFNMRYNAEIKAWIIFQYCLDEEIIA